MNSEHNLRADIPSLLIDLFLALIVFGLVVPAAAQDTPPLAVSYETALIPVEYSLNVRSQPGYYSGDIVDVLQSGVHVQVFGPAETPNGVPWVPITYGQGETGWIERRFITGRVDPAKFCSDARVLDVIAGLQEAVRNEDGTQLAEIVSPRGLYVAQYGDTSVFLKPDEVSNFFEDTLPRTWYFKLVAGGPRTESLAGEVTEKLQRDLLPGNISIACNDNQDTISIRDQLYAVRLPGYEAHNFYSIMRPGESGHELDWGAWGLVFEYWDDQPVLMAIGYYVWTP